MVVDSLTKRARDVSSRAMDILYFDHPLREAFDLLSSDVVRRSTERIVIVI